MKLASSRSSKKGLGLVLRDVEAIFLAWLWIGFMHNLHLMRRKRDMIVERMSERGSDVQDGVKYGAAVQQLR